MRDEFGIPMFGGNEGTLSRGPSIVKGLMDGYFGMRDRLDKRTSLEQELADRERMRRIQEEQLAMQQDSHLRNMQIEAQKQKAAEGLTARLTPTTEQLFMPGGDEGPSNALSPTGQGLMQGAMGNLQPNIPQNPYLSLSRNPAQDSMVTPEALPNPAYDERRAAIMEALQRQGTVQKQHAPLTANEAVGFVAQNPDLAPVIKTYADMQKDPKEEFWNALYQSGKYVPDSIEAFRTGKGKLEFTKDQSAVTWSEPYAMNAGGKMAMVQRSSSGQIKPVIEDKSTTVIAGNNTKPKPSKPLNASTVDDLTTMKSVYDALNSAGSLVSSGKVSTGPAAGRSQSVGAYVGLSTDDFNSAKQALATAENIMLKLRSGAAVTEPEFNRFKKEYPNVNDPPAVFERKMKNTLKYTEELIGTKLNAFEESGYKVPRESLSVGGKTTSQPSGVQAGRFTVRPK